MATRSETPVFGQRLKLITLAALLLLGSLAVRLWYMQVVKGAEYRYRSENNRLRKVRTLAPRGAIYDREHKVLVRNRPAFNISLILEDTPDVEDTLSKLAQISGRDVAALKTQLNLGRSRRHFEPKVVIPDASLAELARVKVNGYKLPGVIVDVTPTRAYPYRSLAAQTLGYAREITRTQLESLENQGYWRGDLFGQSGLEKQWEGVLRGKSGSVTVEVDAMGNRRRELNTDDYQPGNDLHLTLDLDLQLAAEKALEGKKGSVIAIDPQSGQVLAMVSAPSFDVNVFSGAMLPGEWQKIESNRAKPLTNRTISNFYPPGSTIKLLWATAGLSEHKISESSTFSCPGFYMFAGRPYRCHKKSGHGGVELRRAVTVSCNVFFYQLGQALGIQTLHKYGDYFGLGRATGVGLPGEADGKLPSEEWKLRHLGERWYPGDTLPVAIGQGYLVVTPIQMACAIGAIANGGTYYKPYIVERTVNPAGQVLQSFEPQIARKLPVPPKVLDLVRSFAADVVNRPDGTGRRSAFKSVIVGGKTGTAQASALGRECRSEECKDHAWFIAFGPFENPTIAMAVMVENAGHHGGVTAAPIAREVLAAHFLKRGLISPEEAAGVPPVPGVPLKPLPPAVQPERQSPEEQADLSAGENGVIGDEEEDEEVEQGFGD